MNIGVIFAGGVGSRMHSREIPKQFLTIAGKPIIVHTIEKFEKNPQIDTVVVVCIESWIGHLESLIYKYRLEKVKKVVPGGETGQMSIYHGLVAAEELAHGEPAVVLIHDGVRPLINEDLLSRNVNDVKKYGSSITSGIVKETIVEIAKNGTIKNVPDREHSRVAKAPQCFWLKDILCAHRKALQMGKRDFIDSCSMMKYYGYVLHMTDGPYENMKITTPDDFYAMRAILQAQEDKQIYGIE